MAETKIIYHLDDQDTPYLVKLQISADRVTLLDLKTALSRPNYKYFFKSMDDDFGVVKEEILDDHTVLPSFNGRVVTWLVAADSSLLSDAHLNEPHDQTATVSKSHRPNEAQQTVPTSSSSLIKHIVHGQPGTQDIKQGQPASTKLQSASYSNRDRHHYKSHHYKPGSSMMSSDIDTSFVDSDASTRISTTTDVTSPSSYYNRRPKHHRRKLRLPVMSQASSFSSITDSTMSLNIITVTFNMEASSFLGISIVGQTCKGGDGGIYVGSIMKGGMVAQDGRIEPGDMLLEVNGVSFENMNNDDAVRTLREAVQCSGPITLVLAKCWDPNPKGYFTIPRQEQARPIDPSAWVLHTQAARGMWGAAGKPSVSSVTSSSSILSSMPENEANCQLNRSSATSSSSQSSRKNGGCEMSGK